MPTVATRSTARTTLATAAVACIVVVALCDDGLASVSLFTGATAQADAVEYASCRREDGILGLPRQRVPRWARLGRVAQ